MKQRMLRTLSVLLLLSFLLGTFPLLTVSGAVTPASDTAQAAPAKAAASQTGTECDYGSLYVKRGLVGLFTAFRGGNTVVGDIWQNEAGPGSATLRGGSFWKRKELGVGYRMDLDTWNSLGSGVGISLPENFENYESFSVEVLATVEGVTDEKGNRFVNDYDAEAGTGKKYGYFKSGASAFRFGLLSSLFFVTLDTSPSSSLTSRWFLLNRGYPGANPAAAESEMLVSSDSGWRTGIDEIPTASVMHIGKKTVRKEVTYSVGYNDDVSRYEMTVTAERHAELLSYPSTDASGRFSLFNGLPSTVYAIRVYDRELTEEDKRINSFVDKAAYHGIDVSGFSDFDSETKERVYDAFSYLDIHTDAATFKEAYEFALAGKSGDLSEGLVTFAGYRPILGGAMGYRVLFEVDRDRYDIFTELGCTVRYGAVVSADKTAPLLGEAGTTRIDVNGEHGSHLYSDLAHAGGYLYSVAVTGESKTELATDVTVRGYLEIIDADGDRSVTYIDPQENSVLDGRVSVKDAAVHYVNGFEGDTATAYTYMNSAALRSILAAFGIAGRYSLADDLVLYVDAARGKDTNNGRSEGTAYATLAAAMAAAKAHLGKPGRKTVTLHLSEGRHYVTEELTLSGTEILADAYSFSLVGKGESTVITSEREIDLDGRAYDPVLGMSYVQLPKEGGAFPHFRAVYGDGELLDISHRGTNEDASKISAFYVLDGAGRRLTTEGNDWSLSAADAANAKYGVMEFSHEFLNADVDPSLYAGAELHFIVLWTSHMAHIDHVEVADECVRVYLPYHEIPSFNKSYSIKDSPAWLVNDDALLFDHPDTYHYDSARGRVYYHDGDESLDGFSSLTYAGLERIFSLSDVENFSVEGVRFTGLDSKYITPECGVGCGQGANTVLHPRDPDLPETTVRFMEAAPIFAKHIDGLTVRNVTVDGALGSGVVCKGRVENVVIDSSAFTNLGNAAIHLGDGSYGVNSYVKGVEITNNYVYNIGTLYPASVAIIATFIANARVIGNTVISVPYSAFSFGWMWSTVDSSAEEITEGDPYDTFALEIAYNYVRDFMTCTGDGGAFYLLGGTVRRSERDKTPYNFMHHNYVIVTERTARHNGKDTTARNLMCYYHDNSSSNWLDAENVLIHMAKSKPTYRGVYHQSVLDCEAQNNVMKGNYFVGFSSLSEVHRNVTHTPLVNSQFGITGSDYVYPSVKALGQNESTGYEYLYNLTSKPSPKDASTTVAGIFAAAGSSLSDEGKESGLSWTAPAVTREIWLKTGDVRVDQIGVRPRYNVTVTDGTKTEIFSVSEGEPLGIPALFVRENYNTVFSLDGEVIDPYTYKITQSVMLRVTYTPRMYPVKFYSVIEGVETVYAKTSVAYGHLIFAPDPPESVVDAEGNRYVFVRWDGYTDGMPLRTEGATFRAIFRNDGKHFYDDGHDTECNVCGAVRDPVHDFYSEWQVEEERHYHACSGCDERSGEGPHTMDGGTVTKKPTAEEFGERTYTCTVCGFARTEPIDAPPVMLEAPDRTTAWQKGSAAGLRFRSDAPFSELLSVSLDGETLAPAEYTASEGSTVILLSASFLDTLSTGEHTLTIHSASGDAGATFTVADAPVSEGTPSAPNDTPAPTGEGGSSFPFAIVIPVGAVLLLALLLLLLRKRKGKRGE